MKCLTVKVNKGTIPRIKLENKFKLQDFSLYFTYSYTHSVTQSTLYGFTKYLALLKGFIWSPDEYFEGLYNKLSTFYYTNGFSNYYPALFKREKYM